MVKVVKTIQYYWIFWMSYYWWVYIKEEKHYEYGSNFDNNNEEVFEKACFICKSCFVYKKVVKGWEISMSSESMLVTWFQPWYIIKYGST